MCSHMCPWRSFFHEHTRAFLQLVTRHINNFAQMKAVRKNSVCCSVSVHHSFSECKQICFKMQENTIVKPQSSSSSHGTVLTCLFLTRLLTYRRTYSPPLWKTNHVVFYRLSRLGTEKHSTSLQVSLQHYYAHTKITHVHLHTRVYGQSMFIIVRPRVRCPVRTPPRQKSHLFETWGH